MKPVPTNAEQTRGGSQRGRLGPAHICRSWTRGMATTLGNWLRDRPLRRLFHFHIDVLPRLAPAVAGRGSPHGLGGGVGKLAIFSTGSLVLFCGGVVQRSRGAGSGSAC